MAFTTSQLQRMREIAVAGTPKDTGTLRNSVVIIPTPDGVCISWLTRYSAYVQERGKSKGYQTRVYDKINDYIASIRIKSTRKLKEHLKDPSEKVIIEETPHKVIEVKDADGDYVRDVNGKIVTKKIYSGRTAVNDPNPLIHPDDPTVPARVKSAFKQNPKQWTSFNSVASIIDRSGNPVQKNKIAAGVVKVLSANGKRKGVGLDKFMRPTSSLINADEVDMTRGEFKAFQKTLDEMVKNRPQFERAIGFNSYMVFTDPNKAIEYANEMYIAEVNDYNQRMEAWFNNTGPRPELTVHITRASREAGVPLIK